MFVQSSWGKHIVYSLFGESHGPMIGITLHHLPAGIKIDMEAIKKDMSRRRPGKNKYSTPRNEKDQFEIVSGMLEGYTTGAPLTALIHNTDQRSRDYSKVKSKMRPSHADYAAYVKYKGHNDYRGGGHFSGRLTAPIVFAGGIAKQLLMARGIQVKGRIASIGPVKDADLDQTSSTLISTIKGETFPLVDQSLEESMKEVIDKARMDLDSVGGAIDVVAVNVPAGLGEPFFNSVESTLSHLFYSIPAVKMVAFGSGMQLPFMRASEANDAIMYKDGAVRTLSNHNGGVTGGITNGMPLIARLHIKPTPTIDQDQKMIDIENKENIVDHIEGRHDPCIVPRAVPVAEAMMAMGLVELVADEKWTERWCPDDTY